VAREIGEDRPAVCVRIFIGTLDARLISKWMEPREKPCADFGSNGEVDLAKRRKTGATPGITR